MDVDASADGRLIAAVSVGGDIALAELGGRFRAGKNAVNGAESVAFDSGGSQVAFAGFGVQVNDTRTGALQAKYEQPMGERGRGAYEAVRFMPDGRHIVAVSVEGVDSWAVGKAKAIGPTIGCDCSADGVSLSADGSRAVFGTADGHLVVVDTVNGHVLVDRTVSQDSTDHVFAVAASDDGRLAVGFSSSGKGLLWDIQAQRVAWRGTLPGLSSARLRFYPSRVRFADSGRALLLSSQTNERDDVGFAPSLITLAS